MQLRLRHYWHLQTYREVVIVPAHSSDSYAARPDAITRPPKGGLALMLDTPGTVIHILDAIPQQNLLAVPSSLDCVAAKQTLGTSLIATGQGCCAVRF